MKVSNFINIKSATTILVSSIAVMAFLFQSCNDDDENPGPMSFGIEGDPTGLTTGVAGKTESYVVRSNRPWKIVTKGEGDWVKVFPDEGDDDGIFKVIVSANNGFDERIMNLAFVVDGEEQPVLFRVEQDANVPNIVLEGPTAIPAAGGNVVVNVTANVAWNYVLADDSWLSEVLVESNKVTLAAVVNNGSKRSTTMTVTAVDHPEVTQIITLEQSPGTVVLEETFDWLAYGSAVPYTTTGETIITNWSQEQQDKGWTSSLNPISNDRPLYARQGFVKLGKTNYGGDLISPKLSNIDGTKKVKVTFKAVAYVSAAGTVIDTRELKIFVLGAGTTDTDALMIENVPNTQPQDTEGVVNDVWDPARAFSFTITGATAETQIRFLGKDFDLRTETVKTNRIFIDDIKVEIIE